MDLRFSRDPAWLDREYNNRALVPEHARHFEHWAQASAAARAQGQPLLDLSYGHGPGEQLDIFPARRTRSAGPAPVLFFIHGGYWRSLDKGDHSFIAPVFQQLGVCVVVINYALCPAVTIPHITLQVVQALAWTQRHIAAHGGDASRITVAGHSAGGHLANMMLACEWPRVGSDLPATLVKNAIAISAVNDLEPVRCTPFVQPSLNLTPAQVKKASPARLPSPGLRGGRGQLFSLAGGDESSEFRRQNRLIRQAWGPDVVPVCEDLPGLNHFSIVEAMVQPGHRLHQLTRELLAV